MKTLVNRSVYISVCVFVCRLLFLSFFSFVYIYSFWYETSKNICTVLRFQLYITGGWLNYCMHVCVYVCILTVFVFVFFCAIMTTMSNVYKSFFCRFNDLKRIRSLLLFYLFKKLHSP